MKQAGCTFGLAPKHCDGGPINDRQSFTITYHQQRGADLHNHVNNVKEGLTKIKMHIQRLEFGGLSVWLRNGEGGREGVRISRSTEGRRLPQPIIFFVLRKTSRNHDKGRRNKLSSFVLIEF